MDLGFEKQSPVGLKKKLSEKGVEEVSGLTATDSEICKLFTFHFVLTKQRVVSAYSAHEKSKARLANSYFFFSFLSPSLINPAFK